jgi:hypothetical protein
MSLSRKANSYHSLLHDAGEPLPATILSEDTHGHNYGDLIIQNGMSVFLAHNNILFFGPIPLKSL